MSIWNKILIGLIFIASVAFFYMAARTLKTHQYWKSVAQGYVFLIGVQEEFADACKNGDTSENGGRLALLPQDAGEDDSDTNELRQIARDGKCDLAAMERRIQVIEEKTPGTDRTRFEVSCLTQERGRAWYSCTPQAGADGAVRVVVSETEAHGITLNSEIFVFEEWPLTRDGDGVASGGRYLGEFVVTAVDEENQVWIDLKPVMKPTAEEQKLIDASVAGTVPWINDAGTVTWALYARMPLDDHEIFVEMSDEDLAILMPTDTLSEYTHDGDEAAQTDLDQWAVEGKIEKGKYVRALRDYRARFKYYHQQRPILIDKMETAIRDAAFAVAAQVEAEKERDFRRAEVAMLKQRLTKYERERDAAKAHLDMLKVAADNLQKSVDQISLANRATSARIAQTQKTLAEQIEARTRRMAGAPSGGN